MSGMTHAEHRPIGVAFLKISGLDSLILDEGPDQAARDLSSFVQDVQKAADLHGLTFLASDLDRDGAKIILVAGAPARRGHDEDGLLLALRQVVPVARRLEVRGGVTRGHVFCGDVGPSYRRTYTVMGDAVNLAARLMAAAPQRTVLASETILSRTRTVFSTRKLEPFSVKGKKRPVQAYELGGASAHRSARRSEGHLIGREAEIDQLRAAMDLVATGCRSVIQIVGEPGIGKSRLIEELLTDAGAFRVVSGSSLLYQSTTPFFSLRPVLRTLLGLQDDDATARTLLTNFVEAHTPELLPWLPLIGIPLGLKLPEGREVLQLDERLRKDRMEEGFAKLVSRYLSTTPTMILIEDAQWMDEASRGLLRTLAQACERRPLLICLVGREADQELEALEGAHVMNLGPLDAKSAAGMIDELTESCPLPDHEVETLAQRSGGHPLFLMELLRARSLNAEGLPDSIEEVIIARIDSLEVRERRLLRYASVLGARFSRWLFDAVVPGSMNSGELLDLNDFLVPSGDGDLRFEHALIRDVAYQGLPFYDRKRLHRLVGEKLEPLTELDPEPLEAVLSWHLFEAGVYDKAWERARNAARRAAGDYANVDAASLYDRALSAAKRASVPACEKAASYEELGDVCDRAGLYARAATSFRGALPLRRDEPIHTARLCLKIAWMCEREGRLTQALRWITRGRGGLEGLQTPEAIAQRAQLEVFYAGVRHRQGFSKEAIEHCRRAIQDAERGGDLDALAHAYFILDLSFVALGHSKGGEYSWRALDIYRQLGDLAGQAVVYNNLGAYAYFEGRWNDAIDLYEKGRLARTQLGDPVNAAYGPTNIGEILSDQGHFEKAEELLIDALRVWRAAGFRWGVAYVTNQLGRLAGRRGDYTKAVDLLRSARAEFRAVGSRHEVVETDLRIAEILVQRNQAQEGLDLVERVKADLKQYGGQSLAPMVARIAGCALMQLGRFDEAAQALRDGLEAARERQALYEVGVTLDALDRLDGLSGQPSLPTRLQERKEIFKRLGIVSPGTSQVQRIPVAGSPAPKSKRAVRSPKDVLPIESRQPG